ncbi:hypothetical protein AVEN_92199-1 [Araneus ventricosus]|uniref:Uncharacterized protein n=1 Tax=Araneus ventricosus TaxID=182803 RepID=A0A4Y2AMP3_ARAVE|nr:hypothetical protein AVEN_92199-1 [Araneus ventricosus]
MEREVLAQMSSSSSDHGCVSRCSRVITANVSKRKAFSIGGEKHGVNDFSQNEIVHFEYCDDDVIRSGEVSEEDIVALVNEKKKPLL